ncbi:hypothetical protein KAURM247S_01885 [Kitasatospora aureofaciens]
MVTPSAGAVQRRWAGGFAQRGGDPVGAGARRSAAAGQPGFGPVGAGAGVVLVGRGVQVQNLVGPADRDQIGTAGRAGRELASVSWPEIAPTGRRSGWRRGSARRRALRSSSARRWLLVRHHPTTSHASAPASVRAWQIATAAVSAARPGAQSVSTDQTDLPGGAHARTAASTSSGEAQSVGEPAAGSVRRLVSGRGRRRAGARGRTAAEPAGGGGEVGGHGWPVGLGRPWCGSGYRGPGQGRGGEQRPALGGGRCRPGLWGAGRRRPGGRRGWSWMPTGVSLTARTESRRSVQAASWPSVHSPGQRSVARPSGRRPSSRR